MFARITVEVDSNNPLRDLITDQETGISIQVIHTDRELFIPMVHMSDYQDGFFISFKDDPRDRYNGFYLIFNPTDVYFECDMEDVLVTSIGYCKMRNLPEPACIVPITRGQSEPTA